MRQKLVIFLCSLLAMASGVGKPGAVVKNFQLQDHAGQVRELYQNKDAKLVVLFYGGNGCPIVRKSIQDLKGLRDRFASQGVVFWIINANPQDDMPSIQEEAREFQVDLPILKDASQSVTRALGARRTAEAIVLKTADWSVIYRGALSDRFGYGTQKVKDVTPYLENALKNHLAGRPIKPAQTEVRGCAITLEEELKKVPEPEPGKTGPTKR